MSTTRDGIKRVQTVCAPRARRSASLSGSSRGRLACGLARGQRIQHLLQLLVGHVAQKILRVVAHRRARPGRREICGSEILTKSGARSGT